MRWGDARTMPARQRVIGDSKGNKSKGKSSWLKKGHTHTHLKLDVDKLQKVALYLR